MKRLITLIILAVCMLALLAGCSGQENEIGDINNYTPIALFDDAVVYNYIDESGALVIGNYDFSSKKYSDTASVEEFYISSGKPAVIDDSIILPITLNTNEHKLLRVNTDSTTFEIIFNEFNPYPMDIVSTMYTDIYMLSTKKDDLATATYVRKYNENTGNMDICIEKQFTDIAGEQITAFACSNQNIYVLVNNMEGENDVHIEIYDGKTYDLLVKLYFESELRDFVSNNGIVEFYCFDGYVYIRNFSDYGVIGKIENNQIKTVLELPNLRMAYNGKNTQDDYYVFFVRGGRELYLLDVYADILYKTSLELSQDESIRNAISDGKSICISILDEKDTESYTTKKTIIMDIQELKEKAYQSK